MTTLHAAITTEFILGGQKSGKSRRAELLARDWLAQAGDHRAVLIATAEAWDDEMRERIARHQRDRALRVPGLRTIEEPRDLAAAVARHSAAHTLVVVDCLTLWLTHWTMPVGTEGMNFEQKQALALDWKAQAAMFWKQFGNPQAPWFWWATKSAWGSSRSGERCAPLSMPWAP